MISIWIAIGVAIFMYAVILWQQWLNRRALRMVTEALDLNEYILKTNAGLHAANAQLVSMLSEAQLNALRSMQLTDAALEQRDALLASLPPQQDARHIN